MKRLFLVFGIVLCIASLKAQSWTSSSRITSTISLIELASAISNNGDVFTFGYFEGTLQLPDGQNITSNGDRDYYLIKFLSDGTVDWAQNFGSPARDYLQGGVDVDASGNAYIAGGFQGVMQYSATESLTSSGIMDAFLMKITSNGDVEWAKNIGQGAHLQYVTSLKIDNTNDILVAGTFRDSIVINESVTFYSVLLGYDAFYAKFNPANGDLNWAKQVKSLNGNRAYIWDIEVNSSNYYFVGTFTDTVAVETDTLTSVYSNFNVFSFGTDLSGNEDWIRKIDGNDIIYGFSSALDDEGNFYVSSYYNADTIYIETSEDNYQEVVENNGALDIYCVKYNSSGDMDWYRSIGGKGNERVFDIEFFDEKIFMAGNISDTVQWGGIELTTSPPGNQDMFTGALDKDGNFREANTTYGEDEDESRAIFQNGDQLYTVMRSNSDNLVIGDSIYDADEGRYYLVLGVIGCLPIAVDTSYKNVEDCYGYSTGNIRITPTGGFGGPWLYSIDNNQTSSSSDFFEDLPAGDYQVVVVDSEGCSQTGPLVTLTQPDSLAVTYTATDIVVDTLDDGSCTIDITQGSISAVVTGGTVPYEYVLYPGGILQATSGTYFIDPGDSGMYVIRVDDSKNCGPVEADSIEVRQFGSGGDCIIDGIEDGLLDQVKIYPNPTTGLFTLEMPFNEAECSMEVYNMNGQIILQKQLYSNSGKIAETIDLSQASKGLYLIRIDNRALKSAIVVK